MSDRISQRVSMVGRRFGKWTVVSLAGGGGVRGRHIEWLSRCDCGTLRAVDGASLRAGRSQACGCDGGSPYSVRSESIERRIERLVTPEAITGCHLWTGYRNRQGYGLLRWRRRMQLVHRITWELNSGSSPGDDLCVLHRCDTPACVNPEHLFTGTRDDNSKDMVAKNRQAAGERGGAHVLTVDAVRQVRALSATGKTHRRLAEMFGVSMSSISLIVNRKHWRCVRTDQP